MPRSPRDRRDVPWRRPVFVVWVGLTIVAAAYVGAVGPFTAYFHERLWIVGVVVPPLMILLLGIGLGWLVWLVTAPRPPSAGAREPHRRR